MPSGLVQFLTSVVVGLVSFVIVLGQGHSLGRAGLAGGLGFVCFFLVLNVLKGRP